MVVMPAMETPMEMEEPGFNRQEEVEVAEDAVPSDEVELN